MTPKLTMSSGFNIIGFLGRDLEEFVGFARVSLNKEVKNIKKVSYNYSWSIFTKTALHSIHARSFIPRITS